MPGTNAAQFASTRSARLERLRCALKRIGIILLLLAIPTLSTLAKTSWYLPQADTGHYLNGAIKMRVSHAPVLTEREPLPSVAHLIPPPVQMTTIRREQPKPSLPSIEITAVPQYRPPPYLRGL